MALIIEPQSHNTADQSAQGSTLVSEKLMSLSALGLVANISFVFRQRFINSVISWEHVVGLWMHDLIVKNMLENWQGKARWAPILRETGEFWICKRCLRLFIVFHCYLLWIIYMRQTFLVFGSIPLSTSLEVLPVIIEVEPRTSIRTVRYAYTN